MDKIQAKFDGMKWPYASQDSAAVQEIDARLPAAGGQRKLITYSELAKGLTFQLPSLREPRHVIDVFDWQDLDRAIIGDILGHASKLSYERGGFFSSALVVTKLDGSPSEGFYSLLRALGLIASSKTDRAMYLWADHVARAHTWYASHDHQAT